MAATMRTNNELKIKAQQGMKNAKTVLEKLQCACLARGANGIKGLARTFKIMDDDRSRSLDKDEFKKGIHDYGLTEITPQECMELFTEFDKDGSGTIDFDEFLVRLKPPMSNSRRSLVYQAFKKLDKTGDGVITIEDLKDVYKVNKHPKYLSGEWTEEQVLQVFLDSFDSDDKDGKITQEEFQNYYVGVSASIDNDAYFDLMMRNSWKI